MISDEDRFFIRHYYKLGVPALEAPSESVARIAEALIAIGCAEDMASDFAGTLWFFLHQMHEDEELDATTKADEVRCAAQEAIAHIDELQRALDPRLGDSRLNNALAKALSLAEPDRQTFEIFTGKNRDRIVELLAPIEQLRGSLRLVEEAHTQGRGRPPKEVRANELGRLANHWKNAAGELPAISFDPEGHAKGAFYDFAQMVCREAGARPFSDRDFKALSARLTRIGKDENPHDVG